MDTLRLAPTVGIVGCLAVLAALGVPYLLADSAANVGIYYDTGTINPLLTGLFALVGIIVFAAGREGRTDPDLAAGVMLALGVVMTVVSLAWALTARIDVVAIQANHRWALVAVSVIVPASAAWFARELGVL